MLARLVVATPSFISFLGQNGSSRFHVPTEKETDGGSSRSNAKRDGWKMEIVVVQVTHTKSGVGDGGTKNNYQTRRAGRAWEPAGISGEPLGLRRRMACCWAPVIRARQWETPRPARTPPFRRTLFTKGISVRTMNVLIMSCLARQTVAGWPISVVERTTHPTAQVTPLHKPARIRDNGIDHNPFLRHSRLRDFHQPGYWSRPYGWIAFVPRHPNFTSRPFDRLFRLPRAIKDQKGWCMPKPTADAWLELENSLRGLISHLCNHFEIPAVAPFPPSGHGFLKFHPTRDAAQSCIEASRDWFGLWQGLLSFCLASAHSNHSRRLARRQEAGLDPSICPSWLEYLATQGYEQTWLEGFMTSSVYMFTPSVVRTGLFIDVVDPLDRFLPSLDWYIEHAIPVWYKCPVPGQAYHRYITHRPTDNDLHAFLNFCRTNPSQPTGPTPSSASQSIPEEQRALARDVAAPQDPPALVRDSAASPPAIPGHNDHRDQASQRNKQIEDYRRSQQASFAVLQLTATDRDKQRWASRIKQPPTRKCMVLIWAPDPQNAGVLKKAMGESEDLWDFTEKQKWYDPVQNAWHCCVDLAPHEMTDEDHQLMEDLYGSNYTVDLSLAVPASSVDPPSEASEAMNHSAISPPAPAPSAAGELHPEGWDQPLDQFLPPSQYEEDRVGEEFIQTLSKAMHLPLHPRPNGRGLYAWSGCIPQFSHGAPFFESTLFTFVTSFLRGLCAKGAKPPADAWDMSETSREPIPRSGSLPPLRVIPGQPPLFVVQLARTTSWTLANIALELVRKGIRFSTLLPNPLRTPITTPSPAPERIPLRLPGYAFSKQDYDSYQQSRNILLAEGRLRAALTRGGIIWRMAVAFLSPSDALSGPSASASMVVQSNHDGVICYAVLTYVILDPPKTKGQSGPGGRCQKSSTFLVRNYGRWTSYRENHYIARHKEITRARHNR
ncbi:hypothetical protein BKA70DRAFT_1234629 [Coprinopsis sp. MPI-PUGE-AT-0042]|nr:hypothetical protein BKA70DRAFT_1234629 [Coprinopsis sp. MPI-PUGE-AT-0042]